MKESLEGCGDLAGGEANAEAKTDVTSSEKVGEGARSVTLHADTGQCGADATLAEAFPAYALCAKCN